MIATGTGARTRDGGIIPVSVKEGDKVLLPEYGGTPIVLGDKEWVGLSLGFSFIDSCFRPYVLASYHQDVIKEWGSIPFSRQETSRRNCRKHLCLVMNGLASHELTCFTLWTMSWYNLDYSADFHCTAMTIFLGFLRSRCALDEMSVFGRCSTIVWKAFQRHSPEFWGNGCLSTVTIQHHSRILETIFPSQVSMYQVKA